MKKERSRIALVIGIGYYRHHFPLEYSPSSAKRVFELLINPEFGHCAPEKSTLIMVTEKDDGHWLHKRTQGGKVEENENGPVNLNDEIDNALKAMNPGDQFIFCFCGHGAVRGKDLYLVLPEYRSDDTPPGYSMNRVTVALDDHRVNKAILIVDACHSGAMFSALKNIQGNHWKPDLPEGVVFMSACSEEQFALQGPELQSTLFSHYLCDGIENWQEKQSPKITLRQLGKYIDDKIKENHLNADQNVYISTVGESMIDEVWFSKNPAYFSAWQHQSLPVWPPIYSNEAFVDREEVLKEVTSRTIQGQSTTQ